MSKPKRRPPTPSLFTLATLGQRWNYDEAQVKLYGIADGLQIVDVPTADGPIRAVTLAEVERFESQSKPKKIGHYNGGERESHLYLIGVMAALWAGLDPEYVNAHYRLQSQVETDAAEKGIPMLRSAETDANAIREGLDLLRERGHLPPIHKPKST